MEVGGLSQLRPGRAIDFMDRECPAADGQATGRGCECQERRDEGRQSAGRAAHPSTASLGQVYGVY